MRYTVILETELGWVREFFHNKHVLILLLPEDFVRRLLSKCRTVQGYSYSEDQFGKRLDKYQRLYLSLKHAKSGRR